MAETGTIAVKGLRELNRAFKAADHDLSLSLRRDLRQIAKPVADDAQTLARRRIPPKDSPHRSGIGDRWSEMRVGVTQKFVYVVPKLHGTKYAPAKRPNLVELLLGRAMEPALQQNETRVAAEIGHLLDRVGDAWGRAA